MTTGSEVRARGRTGEPLDRAPPHTRRALRKLRELQRHGQASATPFGSGSPCFSTDVSEQHWARPRRSAAASCPASRRRRPRLSGSARSQRLCGPRLDIGARDRIERRRRASIEGPPIGERCRPGRSHTRPSRRLTPIVAPSAHARPGAAVMRLGADSRRNRAPKFSRSVRQAILARNAPPDTSLSRAGPPRPIISQPAAGVSIAVRRFGRRRAAARRLCSRHGCRAKPTWDSATYVVGSCRKRTLSDVSSPGASTRSPFAAGSPGQGVCIEGVRHRLEAEDRAVGVERIDVIVVRRRVRLDLHGDAAIGPGDPRMPVPARKTVVDEIVGQVSAASRNPRSPGSGSGRALAGNSGGCVSQAPVADA